MKVETETETPSGDGLSPGELAFMNSGGENADLLLSENPSDPAPGGGTGTVTDAAAATAVPDAAATTTAAAATAAAATTAPATTAAAAAPGATEDDPDIVDVPDGKGGKSKHVPFGKFERERKKVTEANQRATDLQARVDDLNEKFTRGDERLRLLAEALNPQPNQAGQGEEDQKPDPTKDIFAYVAWQDRQIEQLKQTVQGTRETVVTDQADRQLRDGYQRDAVAFARETPDFGPAYNFLLTQRAGMLAEQGYAETEIRQILHGEEKGLVERAKATGKRPAQLIYGLAKQLGWRPEMANPTNGAAAPTNGAAAGNSAAAAAAPGGTAGHANGTNGAPSVTAEIERIAAAQAGNKSLQGAGGAASELSLEALSAMSVKEFEELYASKKNTIDRLMGAVN